jgi:hypothetical protein
MILFITTAVKSSNPTYSNVAQDIEDKFVNNASLNGVYQDIQLHGINNTARLSIESRKQNLTIHGGKYLEERFLDQGVSRRATVIFYNFAWPTGSTKKLWCQRGSNIGAALQETTFMIEEE